MAPASWRSSGDAGSAWCASLFRDFGAARDQILLIADAVESDCQVGLPIAVVRIQAGQAFSDYLPLSEGLQDGCGGFASCSQHFATAVMADG